MPPARSGSVPAAYSSWDFANVSKYPLLWVDSHGDSAAEAAYLIPHVPDGARKWRSGFLGLRFVRFSDGHQLVGWCKDCPCGQESNLDRQLELQDRPHQPRSWLGEAPHMCELGEAVVRRFGGPAQLRAQLQRASAEQHGAGRLVVRLPPLMHEKVACTAVRAGDCFRDWGCIINIDHRCASCQSRQRSCAHIGCLPAADLDAAAAASVQPMMLPEAYEEHLAGVFDFEQGCRRRKCLSTLPLPAKLEEPRSEAEQPLCAELLKMYNGETCIGDHRKGSPLIDMLCDPPPANPSPALAANDTNDAIMLRLHSVNAHLVLHLASAVLTHIMALAEVVQLLRYLPRRSLFRGRQGAVGVPTHS